MCHWVHCNKCYKQPTSRGSPVKYNLTSCGHVVCDGCIQLTKQACSERNLPLTCCVCSKRRIGLVAVTSSMNATLKLRFTDPAKLWQLQMRKLAKVTALQSQQATFLRKVVCKQRATLVKADTCCKTLRAQNAELQK
ncbi:RING finger protein [Aphelenchoides avenae]|nr:RING finger protein [Aphelenchus avenae]